MEDRGIDTERLERNVVTHGADTRSANSPYLLHVDNTIHTPTPSLFPVPQSHRPVATYQAFPQSILHSTHITPSSLPPFDSIRSTRIRHPPNSHTTCPPPDRPSAVSCRVLFVTPGTGVTASKQTHHQPPTATYQPSYPRSTAMVAYVAYTPAIFTALGFHHITTQHITAPISTCPAVPSPVPVPAPHYAAQGRRRDTDPNPNPDVDTEPLRHRHSDTNFAARSDSSERVSFATTGLG
jgi:hypothetical protein